MDTNPGGALTPRGGENRKTQIVVVGGGAGGLELVRRLGAKFGRKSHDIILVDKNPSHIWKPLLHEVAAGSLDANLDEVGYRGHCHKWGYRFFKGALSGIDREQRVIHLAPVLDDDGSELISSHTIRYDYLVLAVGSISNDFGVNGVKDHAIYLDSREQADKFRTKLLNHCLRVSRTMSVDPGADATVKVAIVGGGATGVELAAELYNAAGALKHYGLEVFDESRLKVTLLEAGERILPALPERLSQAAHEELERLGVEVRVQTQVIKARKGLLLTRDDDAIRANLIVWAAGVKGAEFLTTLGLETNRNNQILVRETMQTLDDDRVFALGDCCSYTPQGAERPIPPRAQAAHQMADTVFTNLKRAMANEKRARNGKPLKALKPFIYHDNGSLVSLSRFSTVGSLMGNLVGGSMAVEGRLARLIYTSLYSMHLLAIHGWLKGLSLMAIGRVNRIVRPKLKLH
ncbi:MAG: NAD(P)/FAD-dependent oxidoreductase [Erythrobacter sp.]|uniref:NAD(P)/FAD-dependent oxidoreductase n=1 Tax=Erythrobacter sp. TaxID=1042 RepID=UPI0026065051|nr:NAD(P)/FAD-dependent oxidoreductase [Erythrobacter sp.]MDJ0979301.1 NAD(P)/FAD-dependent oxidoreductase [Erythrobacter sp.]